MAVSELNAKLERSRSRGGGGHSRSESETRSITEMRLSSFDSTMGEQVMTRGGGGVGGISMREWAMLVEPPVEGGTTSGGTKKKVMVVIDGSRESRLAMLWALSHIVHCADTLSLIQFLPSSNKYPGVRILAQPAGTAGASLSHQEGSDIDLKFSSEMKLHQSRPSQLGLSLKMLCTSRRPEVEVEVMTVEGIDKGPTIVSQAKKLEASVLVLGQRKPSLLQRQRRHRWLLNVKCGTCDVMRVEWHIYLKAIQSKELERWGSGVLHPKCRVLNTCCA